VRREGDGLYLYEVELTARGYSDLGQHGLSLDRDMVLPDFADPSKKVWPPYEVQFGPNLVIALADVDVRGGDFH
jgi:hypothetical protein